MTEDEERGEIVTVDDADLVPMNSAGEVKQLFEMAIKSKLDVEGLEKLVTLHERVANRHERTEFAEALYNFQNECPSIRKQTTATIKSQRAGTSYSYNFADLPTIEATIRPHLHKNGLSYYWDSESTSDTLKSTCILQHANGHEKRSSFSCPAKWSSGSMSDQQKVAGTNTFGRRQSLVMVLGLTTTEPDTDGAEYQPITEDQAKQLEALIVEVGADRKRFLDFLQADTMESVPIADFEMAVRELRRKGLRG